MINEDIAAKGGEQAPSPKIVKAKSVTGYRATDGGKTYSTTQVNLAAKALDGHRVAKTKVRGTTGGNSYPHNLSYKNKKKFGIPPEKDVQVFPVVGGTKAFGTASDPGRVRLARSKSGSINVMLHHPQSKDGNVDNSYKKMQTVFYDEDEAQYDDELDFGKYYRNYEDVVEEYDDAAEDYEDEDQEYEFEAEDN